MLRKFFSISKILLYLKEEGRGVRVEDSITKDVLEMLLKGELRLERDRGLKHQGSLKIVRGTPLKKGLKYKSFYYKG